MLVAINKDLAAAGQPPFRWKTIPRGPATQVWAGLVAKGEEVGARYCENCHVSIPTDAMIGPVSEGVRPHPLDPERAKALWKTSEELVCETF